MPFAKDITDAEFDNAVVQRSSQIPVVIDLWAPWCGPCRQLGPVLEKIAEERQQDFELVKLNVDENPRVANLLNARSIPLVVGFRDGQAVSRFTGAQAASAIHAFIDELAPSKADLKLREAQQALDEDRILEAEQLLVDAIGIEPLHEDANLTLASLLTHGNRFDEAITLLERVPSNGHDAIANMKAEVRVRMSGTANLEELSAKANANPDDYDTRIELGKTQAASGQIEDALATLLAVVIKAPTHNDGEARKAMLDIFNVAGSSTPVVKEYRRKLSSALF